MSDNLNLCINYDKVLDTKKDVANAILGKRSENNGVCIPFCLIVHFAPTVFRIIAIDNIDIKIDTATGKHQLHGTAMAVF